MTIFITTLWDEQRENWCTDRTFDETEGVPAPSPFEPLGYALEDDAVTALDLLARLFYIVNENVSRSAFASGIMPDGMDEGEQNADRLLRTVREYLAANGDDYARDSRPQAAYPADDETPF